MIKSPKIFFYDVGLCSYLNGVKSFEYINSLPNRSSLFENFIISDVIKSSAHNNLRNDLYFFKNKTGIEVDLIIQDGLKIIPVEIKSSHTFNQSFVKNLNYFKQFHNGNSLGKIIYAGNNQMRENLEILNYHDFFQDIAKRQP